MHKWEVNRTGPSSSVRVPWPVREWKCVCVCECVCVCVRERERERRVSKFNVYLTPIMPLHFPFYVCCDNNETIFSTWSFQKREKFVSVITQGQNKRYWSLANLTYVCLIMPSLVYWVLPKSTPFCQWLSAENWWVYYFSLCEHRLGW
jgi:hypothetical protein